MGIQTKQPLPAEVEQLQRQLQEWRQTRRKSEPVPAVIWDAAVPMAMEFGVCRISRAVGLDYTWLRKKVASAKAKAEATTLGFLELPASLVLSGVGGQREAGQDPCGLPGTGAVIEVSSADGARMRVCLAGAVDAAGIVAAFLGRPR